MLRPPPSEEVDSSLDPSGRRYVRVPFEQPVSLRFQSFKDFVTEVSSNISADGMLIKTLNPKPQGTVFDFELLIDRELTLIQGRGEVVWIRAHSDEEGRPAGMGVRFLELSDSSRTYVNRVVEVHLESGASVFDLEKERPFEDEKGTDAADEVDESEVPEDAEDGSLIHGSDAEDQATEPPSDDDWTPPGEERTSRDVEPDRLHCELEEALGEQHETRSVEEETAAADEESAEAASSNREPKRPIAPWRGSWARS